MKLTECPFCGCEMELKKVGRDWLRIKPVVWHDEECPLEDRVFDYSQSISPDEVARLWDQRV